MIFIHRIFLVPCNPCSICSQVIPTNSHQFMRDEWHRQTAKCVPMKKVCNGCNALINELHCIELSPINKIFAPLSSILKWLSAVKEIQLQRKNRGHWELNPGPIGLQPIALPLSYTPSCSSSLYRQLYKHTCLIGLTPMNQANHVPPCDV